MQDVTSDQPGEMSIDYNHKRIGNTIICSCVVWQIQNQKENENTHIFPANFDTSVSIIMIIIHNSYKLDCPSNLSIVPSLFFLKIPNRVHSSTRYGIVSNLLECIRGACDLIFIERTWHLSLNFTAPNLANILCCCVEAYSMSALSGFNLRHASHVIYMFGRGWWCANITKKCSLWISDYEEYKR